MNPELFNLHGTTRWDEPTLLLSHMDNRARSIAGQTLCNLARSIPPKTRPSRFRIDPFHHLGRTICHCPACLAFVLKNRLEHAALRKQLLTWFAKRFETSKTEKNGALIRYDIFCATRSLFEATKDQAIKSQASALIASETDDKYGRNMPRVARFTNVKFAIEERLTMWSDWRPSRHEGSQAHRSASRPKRRMPRNGFV